MTTLTASQVAALVKKAGFPANTHVTMVAIAKAESGFRVEAVGGPNRNGTRDYGLFQINSVHKYDSRRLTSDPSYNTQCAKSIYDRQGLKAWSTFNSGAWRKHEAEARQGVASASNATGSVVVPGSDPAAQTGSKGITYGGPGPQIVEAGVGTQMASSAPIPEAGGLGPVRLLGADIEGDIGSVIIGNPRFTAAIDTVPNLSLTCVDEDFVLQAKNLWRAGNRIQWSDLDLRIDTGQMEAGGHGTGQYSMTCIDDIVYALMGLKGSRTAHGISASEWIAQELRLVNIDPAKYLLAESVPTQNEIARDVPDQSGENSGDQQASAWSTIVRLAKELGKRVFISGRRLVFGSASFAMQWCAEGELEIGYHGVDIGMRWLTYPMAKRSSIASRDNVLEVVGRVPHNRAPLFRPGVRVRCYRTPGVTATSTLLMVSKIEHDLGTDTDGAEVTLIEPVDPPPQPPSSPDSKGLNSGSTSAGGTPGSAVDGQAGQIVALALQQAGKKYVFGAEARSSDPNPRAFDCSELVEWACARAGVKPTMPDGSAAQLAHCRKHKTTISVNDAIKTKGALLFQPGHVALSLGDGNTIEAMNPSRGVTKGKAAGRGWTAGARIPGVRY